MNKSFRWIVTKIFWWKKPKPFISLGLIRRVYPSLIANQIVSVQPMPTPLGYGEGEWFNYKYSS